MIQIHGVNKRRQKILDKMWSLNDLDELESWKNTLNPKLHREAILLEQLIYLAVLDEIFDKSEDDFTEVNEIIDRCRK